MRRGFSAQRSLVNRHEDGNDLLPAVDLGSGDEKVKKVDCRKFLTPGYTTSGHVELHTVCLRIGFGYYGLDIMQQQ